MFGHPTRDSLDSVAVAQRFLHNNPDCHVVARNGPLAQIVSNKESQCKSRTFAMGTLLNALSILDSVSNEPSAAVTQVKPAATQVPRPSKT